MKVLQEYIKKKESLLNTKSNSMMLKKDKLNQKNDAKSKTNSESKTCAIERFKQEIILIKNENFFDKIENLLNKEKISNNHKNRIKNIFLNFFDYLKLNDNELKADKNEINANNVLSLKRINICDAYNFVKYGAKYKKDSSIKFILSIMRKYIRLINEEPYLNYKTRIHFIKNENKKDLTYRQQLALIKFLKENYDIQTLLLFYFLYYLGLNYSTVSRILKGNFNKNFSELKIRKKKFRRYKIIPSIKKNIEEFIKNSREEKKFLFFEEIDNYKNSNRYKFIRQKIIDVLQSCYYIYKEQINYIISIFYRTRNPKKIMNKINEYLDYEIGISNGIINSEISKFDYDEKLDNELPISEDSSYMDYKDILGENINIDLENNFQVNNSFEKKDKNILTAKEQFNLGITYS